MKKALIWIFLATTFCANLLAQVDEYPSKERDEYYKNLEKSYIPFKPLKKSFISGYKPEYYEIHRSELNTQSYKPEYSSPYLDSILSTMSYREYLRQSMIQTIHAAKIDKICNIEISQILTYEKKDSIEAFIYKSYEFEDRFSGGGPGIWVAYSENYGKDWNYYYTGIVQGQPIGVKVYPPRPLIKEKNKLEIEACLYRQISPFGHPGVVSYERVKDDIYLVFDINVLARDSDGDGLTDIIEDKLYLNKYNKDTDGDGIPDNLDMNPRVHYPRTEITKVYEAILNDEIDWNHENGIGRLLFSENTTHNTTDPTETLLIITDNEDLMGVQAKNHRIIFITKDEYLNKSKPYNQNPRGMGLSPLFKVDDMENTYIMAFHSSGTFGCNYLIRKTKDAWTIEMLTMWIS